MRAAAIAFVTVAVVVAVSARPGAAEAAGWPLALPAAGFCTPAPTDPAYVPRVVKALDLPAAATKPIAILDSGVDASAPELAGRVLPGFDALTGSAVAGDPDGHGTEAAGLAAAAGPGSRGVSPASPILPIRIYDANRASTADSLAKGIALATQKGAGVISISGSGPLGDASPAELAKITRAIDDAFSKGVLVVAGAGDDASAVIAGMPGALPHVLTAGSVTSAGARAALSAIGPWLDLLVPADSVSAPLPAASCVYGFGFSSGTSFAAPMLAGAAALVMAGRPGLATQQYFELVRRAAVDLGPTGRDDETGFGLLDVAAAMTAAPQAKDSSAEVDDDPFWVRGPYAKTHPPLLTKKKLRFKASGSVSGAKDPADVYPVQLTKGDRLVVSVTAAAPGALLDLSVLRPQAGDFDISDGVDRNRAVATGGLSNEPQVELRATRTGTYYIAVEAADPLDPDDPTATPADLDPYRISAYTQHKTKKKRKKKR